jgi:hypothetical protein
LVGFGFDACILSDAADQPPLILTTQGTLPSPSLFTGSEDTIQIRNLPQEIAVNDVIDWNFSVRSFGISNYDLVTLAEAGPNLTTQIGSGAQAVPEPSGAALFSCGLLTLLAKRRR